MTISTVKTALVLLCLSLMAACVPKPPAKLVIMTGQGVVPQQLRFSKASIGNPVVSVPEYLDGYDVIIRLSNFSLEADRDMKWAEKPSSALAQLIRNSAIAAGFTTTGPADYDIQVEVGRFEPTLEGIVVLEAHWLVRDGHDRAIILARGGDVFYQPIPSQPDGAIAAMEAAGRELAGRVVQSIPSHKAHKS